MNVIIVSLAGFSVTASAFAFGAAKLFRKKKPLYFQLYVLACGCIMLERLIELAAAICETEAGGMTAAGFFGMLSFALFILSANRGTLDGIVDDRREGRNRRARLLALAAPAVTAPLVVADVLVHAGKTTPASGILLFIALIPVIPASYYNLKHLLLPMDEIGLLRATRPCNVFALLFLTVNTAFDLLSVISAEFAVTAVCSIGSAVLAALLVAGAVKGEKRWKI